MRRVFRNIIHTNMTHLNLSLGLAWRNATRSKYRSLLLIFGILLTIALETGIVVSIDTLYNDFILDHRNQNFTDITVNPKSWLDLKDLEGLSNTIQHIPGVSKASPAYYTTITKFLELETTLNVLLYGIDPKNHPDFPHIRIIEGKREVSGYTIMISQTIQDAVGVTLGEAISLKSFDTRFNDIQIIVGGVMSDEPYIANKLLFPIILVDLEILLSVIPEDQKSNLLTEEIAVSVDNLVNINKISENIKDEVGQENYVFIEKDISEIEVMGIYAYQAAMNLLIIASFIVEFLFLTNILVIAIKDRQKEIGTLRAVGTNSRQLIALIIVEILFYSIIGSILGVILGISFSVH
ncbi:MAG: FtsX-like permease family protein, partial [Candidatus Heimdallarchaeota archaeon]